MIVRQLDELTGSPQEVVTPNWTSRRLLLKRDGMGFSMHETIIQPGTRTHIWYKHHLEAVLCIEGEGEVEVLPEGSQDTTAQRVTSAQGEVGCGPRCFGSSRRTLTSSERNERPHARHAAPV